MDAIGPIVIIMIFVGVFGGIIFLAFYFGKRQAEKNWDYFIRLGQAMNIPVTKPKIGYWMAPLGRLRGNYRNMDLNIYTDKRHSGKNTYYYTVIRLHLPANPGFEFQLAKENFFRKIGKAFGMQDIQTGNETFDKAFVLKSKDEQRALMVFDFMLTNHLGTYEDALHSTVFLENSVIHYEEMVMISNEETLRRVQAVSNLCVDIAEKILSSGHRSRY